MTKLDHKRELRALYSARRRPTLVDVPELRFAMLEGQGAPSTAPAFAAAVQALYTVSYTVRFALKREGIEYTVMPLEGLFAPEGWDWTLMIMQPDTVTPDAFAAARDAAAAKQPQAEAIARVRLEPLAEGRAAQILHVGPYDAEAPTIERLHAFIAAQGYTLAGRHHEIYVGDPRRTAPDKLRTIIRQPVA